jgi:endo-1,4-beta-xylanase
MGLLITLVTMNHTQAQTPTLRLLAEQRKLSIGAAVRSELLTDAQYAKTLSTEFNMLTAENDMKFSSVQPREGKFDFARGDKIVAFAQKHKMKVRGHTLVWHTQVANWVTESRCKDAEKILQTHITNVVKHFKGKLVAWDVVNEGIDDNAQLRDTFWSRCIGDSYIEKAFRWARAADPTVKLFYNDYGIEFDGAKAKRVFELVSKLKKAGVPIDGVGLQMHLDRPPSDVFLGKYMKQFEDIGLDVHITEMDVRLPQPAGFRDFEMQTLAYRMAMRRCLQAKNCTAFVLWGFTDRHSWIPDFFNKYGSALIFDEAYKPKSAYKALIDELKAKQ